MASCTRGSGDKSRAPHSLTDQHRRNKRPPEFHGVVHCKGQRGQRGGEHTARWSDVAAKDYLPSSWRRALQGRRVMASTQLRRLREGGPIFTEWPQGPAETETRDGEHTACLGVRRHSRGRPPDYMA